LRRCTYDTVDLCLSGYRLVTGPYKCQRTKADASRERQTANETLMLASEGLMAFRRSQVAAHRRCKRHRIKWLGQHTLGAK
jgi:hypothetical protein